MSRVDAAVTTEGCDLTLQPVDFMKVGKLSASVANDFESLK